ncbi:MAG: pitrilysin family protein [Actinomycetaceae bacterium]|nr:pitrilysin family protein [Actinomycetaceae bacterium]MDU0970004.1 pitrilysin family protein [Actinomycetaceae bacterium]
MKDIFSTPLPVIPGTTQEFSEGTTPIRRTVLPSGVRVISQYVSTSPSVALSAWVPVGARDEQAGHEGSTHYLEHLLFKGTGKRSASDIARAFDRVGGESNATTTKEYTNYYAIILREDLPMACEVLLDMVTSPALAPDDFAVERGVIINELQLAADDPIDVATEAFAPKTFGAESALSRPTGGTISSVEATSLDAVRDHHARYYRPASLLITAAGNVDHDALVAMVEENLAAGGWDLVQAHPFEAPRRVAPSLAVDSEREIIEKPVELAYVLTGYPAMSAADPRRPILSTLAMILGGGMSSRLFQEVREKRGLAYSTYAYTSAYTDAGYLALYAGCPMKHVDEVERCMVAQLEDLADAGPTPTELDDAFGQLRGSFALGLDDNRSRMSRLGGSEIVRHSYTTVADHLAGLQSVTRDDVIDLARAIVEQPRACVVVGPGRNSD